MTSYRVPALAAIAFAIACGAATSADVVVKAGKQELTVTRLSDILGNSSAPLEKDVARTIAEIWMNYQLTALAAAKADSMKDNKAVDAAMWSDLETTRVRKLYENVSKTFDTTSKPAQNEEVYNAGTLLMAARHILVQTPPNATPEQRDAARRKADGIRAQVTPANFVKMAGGSNDDQVAKAKGGDLGLFAKGSMVPEFEKAVVALKPGEISPVIQTQFGYHIIMRTPYAEVKDQVTLAMSTRSVQVAESTYLAKLETGNAVKVETNAGVTTKAIARNPLGYMKDNSTLATFKGGKLTASRMAEWIAAYPPQNQIKQQLLAAPDSQLSGFVRLVVRNELLLKQADSAKVAIDSAEIVNMRMQFRSQLTGAWTQLGIDPARLADSAKTESDREVLAGKRIETYFDKLIKNEVQFVDIPYKIARGLQAKYPNAVNDAALDKAIERAKSVRATADSLRTKDGKPTIPTAPTTPPPAAPEKK